MWEERKREEEERERESMGRNIGKVGWGGRRERAHRKRKSKEEVKV